MRWQKQIKSGRSKVDAIENHAVIVSSIHPQSSARMARAVRSVAAPALGRPVASTSIRTSATRARSPSGIDFAEAQRHALRRPHADGDRVGGVAGARPPVHRGRGFLPGPQRLAVEPVQPAPQAGAAGHSTSRPTTTPRPPAGSSNGGCARATRSRQAHRDGVRGARRLLHAADGHGRPAGAGPRRRSPASRRWWPRPTTTWRSRRSSARWPICPDVENAQLFEPHPEEIYAWKV